MQPVCPWPVRCSRSGFRAAKAASRIQSGMRLLPWKSSRLKRATSFGAVSVGAVAVGALAIGATAIGALAIGAISIRRLRLLEGRLDHLHIDHLSIGRLDVQSYGSPEDEGSPACPVIP
jgi:hypothetical protein